MAGISIELRKLLQKGSLTSLTLAFGYSATLSSGNWLIAVFSIFFFSQLAYLLLGVGKDALIYQVLITYAVAISLILSGPFQLMFTRYVADRLFEKELEKILPNYLTALVLCMLFSFGITILLTFYLFEDKPYYYHVLFSFTVSVLSGLWLTNALLVGLKRYKHIFLSFAVSYVLSGILFVFLIKKGLALGFTAYYIGQFLLLNLLMLRIMHDYPSDKLVDFDFLNKRRAYYSLAFAGFFYNFGIWADKFVFWFSPLTGESIFANIRTSVVYDIPVILSYVSLLPGMAVFFLKIEVEFAERYDEYYKAVREWGTLELLYKTANRMIEGAKAVFYETLRVQTITNIFILFLEGFIFRILKISFLYIPLFHILLLGATLQLGFMVLFALISYFDLRRSLAILSFSFASLNFILSITSQLLGPYYYGYGYAASLLIANILGMITLRRFLSEIHYRTYMLRN